MGVMERLKRQARRSGSPRAESARFNPLVVEAVEPRLLMSSTALSGHQAQNLAQALHDNLTHFESVLAAIDKTDVFANSMPLIGASDGTPATLGSLVKLDSLLDASIVAPIQAYVTQLTNGTQTPATSADVASELTTDINAALGSAGTATVTDHSNNGNIDLVLTFSTSVTENFPLTLGANTNITGLTVPTDVQGTLKVELSDFTFETVVAATSKILTDSAVQATGAADLLDGFTVSNAGLHIETDASIKIPKGDEFDAGLLSLVTTAPVSAGYSASLDVALSGSFSGADLQADANAEAASDFSFLTGVVTDTVDTNPNVVLTIPLDLSSDDMLVPGLGGGFDGHIGFTGTVLGNNWSSQVVRDSGLSLDTIQHFATLSPANILAAFQSLDSYISGLAGSQLTDVAIPFTHGLTISQVIDFSSNFEKDIVDKLTPISDVLGFTSGQTATAVDGSHPATLIFTPGDLSSGALPASFSITLTANGDLTSLALTNQYADAQGNLHTITTVDNLATAINQALAAAAAGSTLATVAAELAVTAVNGNAETLAVSGNAVTLGGAVNSGDKVQLTVTNTKALSAGPVTVSYSVTSADTLATVTTNLAAAINANATLKAANITASVSGDVVTVATPSGSGTTTLTVPDNAIELTATASGNSQTPASIAVAAPAASFTNIVGLVDDLGSALGFGDDISDVENFLTNLGFHYDPVADAIEFTLGYQTSYSLGGAPTETLSAATTVAAGVSSGVVTIAGAATAGDTVDVTVNDPSLANGSLQVSYIVQTGDTVDSISKGLAAVINGNATLKADNITATYAASGGVLTIAGTANTTLTTGANGAIAFDAGGSLGDVASLTGSGDLSLTASLGLSMTVGFSLDATGAQADGAAITVDGKPIGASTPLFDVPTLATTQISGLTADDLASTTGLPDMQLILRDGTLATIELQHGEIVDVIGGGAPVVVQGTGTDTAALNIGGTATAGDMINVVVTYGSHTDPFAITASASDTPSTLAAAIAAHINADTTLQAAGVTATAGANTVEVSGASATLSASLVSAHGGAVTETVNQQAVTIGDLLTAFNDIQSGNIDVTVGGAVASGILNVTVGGTVVAGDTVSIVLTSPVLTDQVAVSYTVQAGDTAANIAAGLEAAINANAALSTASIVATYTSGDVFQVSGGATIVTAPQSATLTATGEEDVAIGGSVTAGDVMSLLLTGGSLGSQEVAVSYTVASGDTLADVAAGLQSAINDNATLKAAGVTAGIRDGSPETLALTGDPTATVGAYSTALSETGSGGLVLSDDPDPTILNIGVEPNQTVTAGDQINVTVDYGSDTKVISVTVGSTDTTTTLAASLAAAINADTTLMTAGVTASATDNTLSLGGTTPATMTGALVGVDGHSPTETLDQLPVQPGEVLAVKVTPDSEPSSVASYTVQEGDTADDLIAKLAIAIDQVSSTVSDSVEATVTGADSISVAGDRYLTDNGDSISLDTIPLVGATLNFAVDGRALSVTVRQGYSEPEDIIAAIVDAINSAGVEGLSASLSASIGDAALAAPSAPTETIAATHDVDTVVTGGGDAEIGNVLSLTVTPTAGSATTVSTTLQYGETVADGLAHLADNLDTANLSGVTDTLTGNVVGGTISNPTGDVTDGGDSFYVSAPTGTSTIEVNGITVSYTAVSGDTAADVIAHLMDAINANTTLAADGVTGNVSVTVAGGTVAASNAAAETVSTADAPATGAPITTGDVLSLVFDSSKLANPEAVSYVVQSNDTLATIAAGLEAAINADTNLHAQGISATVSSGTDVIVISGNPSVTQNPGTLTLSSDHNGDLTLGGTVQVGDVLALKVTPAGGSASVASYTVQSGDTLSDAYAKLLDAIEGVQSGITASVTGTITGADTIVTPSTTDNNLDLTDTGDFVEVSSGHAGQQLSIVVNGQTVDYTVVAGHTTAQDIVAGLMDAINNAGIDGVSASLDATVDGATLAVPLRAGETLTVAPAAGGLSAIYNTSTMEIELSDGTLPSGSNPTSLGFSSGQSASAAALTTAPSGAVSATSYYQTVLLASPTTTVDYTTATNFLLTLGDLAPIEVSLDADANRTTAAEFATAVNTALASLSVDPIELGLAPGLTIGLAVNETTGHAGDTVTATIDNAALTGGSHDVQYTVVAGDTAATIATGLAAAINADTTLSNDGITATVSGATVSVDTAQGTSTVTGLASSTAETVAAATISYGQLIAATGDAFTVDGAAKTGDVIQLHVVDNGVGFDISYTVVAGDTDASIATALAGKMAAISGISAAASNNTVMFADASGNTVTVTDTSAASDTETVISSLTFATTSYDVLSASASNAVEVKAAQFGLTISPVDTNLYALNGSNVVSLLGFSGLDQNGLDNPVGLITSGALYSPTLSDRFFFANTAIVADVDLELSNLSLTGTVGFIGIQATGEGYVRLEATLALQSPTGSDYVTFHQLSDAYTDGDLSSLWSFTVAAPDGGNWADLKTDSVQLVGGSTAGNIIADLGNQLVTPGIEVAFDSKLDSLSDFLHAKPDVTVTGFDNLKNLQNLSFSDIITGLQTILTVIDNDTGASILDTTIPVVGVSISDVLNYAQDFATFLNQLATNPAGTVAQINTVIQNALGSIGSDVNLSYANGALMLAFDFSPTVTESVPFSIDLASLAADAGITLPSEVTSLVGVDASGSLSVTVGADLAISLGIQLQAPAATASTSLSSLNKGKGIATNGTSAPDLVIITGSGYQFSVDLDSMTTTDTLTVNGTAGTVTVGGAATAGETVSLTIDNATLDGKGAAGSGAVTVNYTVAANDTAASIATALSEAVAGNSALTNAGVTASAAAGVVTLTGASTITDMVGGTLGEMVATINAAATAAGLAGTFASIDGSGDIVFTDAASQSPAVTLTAEKLGFDPTLMIAGSTTITPTVPSDITATVTGGAVAIGGTPAAGDVVQLSVDGHAISYTVQSGDTLSDIDGHLATEINALAIKGLSAQVGGQTDTTTANSSATIAGTVTTGDTVSMTVTYGGSQTQTVSYVTVAGDTAQTIATALATAIDANSTLQTAGVSAVASGANLSVVASTGTATLAGSATATSGTATETVTIGASDLVIAGAAPSSAASAYTVDLVFGDKTVALTVGADNARTTMAALVDAINQQLAATSVDLGVANSANSGTSGTLSELLGAVLDGGKIAFVGAGSSFVTITSFSVAGLPAGPLGITALGFSAATAATDTNAVETIASTLPANIDFTKEYEFQLVVNGTAATIDLKADAARTTATEFVNALNLALGGVFMDQSALGLGATGKSILGHLVDVTETTTGGATTLTFTANDATLGTLHALKIQDVPSSSTETLTVRDLNNSGSAESLGFAAAAQTASAASSANRVLTGSALTDNDANHLFFIDTTNTHVQLQIGASATNLNFSTNLGPLSVDVQGGSAILGAEEFVNNALPLATDKTFAVGTDPGTLTFGLKDGLALNEQSDTLKTAGRLYFSEIGDASSERTVIVGGADTAGDVLSLTITGAKLASPETVTYTVAAGDTDATIATKLAAAINADATLAAAGISANVVANSTGLQVYGSTGITDKITAVASSDPTKPNTATEHISIVNGYANILDISSNIAVSVSLPVYFLGVPLQPVIQIGIGNVLGGSGGNALDPTPWSLNIPNFSTLVNSLASSFNAFSFLNSPEAVINGLNGLLGALDTIFTQQVFGYQLPLIGPALADAGDFIGSIRSTLVGDLNGLVDDYKSAHGGQEPTTADIVQDAVNELLATLGFTGGITITVDAAAKEIDFALSMSKVLFDGTVNLSSDLGIPGLGLSVSNGAVGLTLSTNINLDFVYSQSAGFYLLPSTAGAHAVSLIFAVTIPSNFSVALTLGILELVGVNGSNVFSDADNTTSTGTGLQGGVYVDLHSKTSDGLADLGSTVSAVNATDSGGNQTISLTLPTDLDTTSAYSFQLVVDGTAVTVNVAADSNRTHPADLVAAINSALAQTMIVKSAVDPSNMTKDTESLAALGITATLSGGKLVFTVADSKLGSSPSLTLEDVDIAFTNIGSNIRAEIAANFDLDLQLTAQVTGGSMSLPSISTEMLFAYQLDKVLVGTDDLAQTGVLMPFTFKNVTLDMGQFLSTFLMPILSAADEILGPLKPVLDFLTAPLPGISNIFGHSVSLLDIASLLGAANSDISTITHAITIIDEVENLITSIEAQSSGGDIKYNFGTFSFGNATIGPLANAAPAAGTTAATSGSFDPFSGDSLSNVSLSTAMLSAMSPSLTGSNASQMNALNQVNGIQKDGAFSIPILKDPISLLELLLGQTSTPVTLFQWKLPTVSFNFSSTWKFPLIGFGPFSLDALVGLNVNVALHVTFGYDTEGFTEFKQTGNAFYVFDGFYVDDTLGPQLTFNASITAGAELDLAVVDVSLTGTIGAQIGLTLYDPNGDGRVRPSEIISELETLDNPLDLFVVSGDIYARVDLNVWVGLDLGFFGTITLFRHDFNFVNAVLVSFTLTPPTHPVLATQSSDGTVTLNTGTLSAERLTGNTGTSGDDYTISSAGGNNVSIVSNGTTQTLNNVSKIVADTGDGNADFTLHDLNTPITITGGDGNNFVDAGGSNDGVFTFGNGNNTIIGTNAGDTVTVGDGNNTIIDGTGNDIITAGNGNNYIDGGAGNDTITVGTGNNTIVGGSGNNTITTGGITGTGNNIIVGGQATSIASTISNGGVTYNVYGPDASGNISNSGVTGDGNNVITTLGNGDNIILAGSGNDTVNLNGSGDNFVVGDTGTAVVTSGANFAAGGHSAVVSVAATGAAGGNDVVDAHLATGDNVILGGGGDDTLTGGSGANVILGDDGSVDGPAGGSGGHFTITATPTATGNDTIVGGVGADVLIGGPGNDSIDGGAGNDIVAGDDATVVRGAALGTAATVISAAAVADGATGSDSLEGGTGDDIVFGGGGADIIDGGSGNNILLGDYGSIDYSHAGQAIVTGAIDTAHSTDGADSITAGDGNNLLMGGGGADSLTAGNGNDIFFGDAGQAVLQNDMLTISGTPSAGDMVTVTVAGQTLNYTTGAHDTDASIATSVAGLINADTALTATGITASTDGGSILLTGLTGISANDTSTALSFTVADYNVVSAQTVDEPFGGADTIAITGMGSNVVFGGAGNDQISLAGPGNNIVLGDFGSVDESVTGQVTVTGRDGNVATYNDGNDTINLLGGVLTVAGVSTAGDVVTATIDGHAFSYTTIAGDTDASIATALAGKINANTALSGLGITASTSDGSVLFTGQPTVSASDTGNTLTFAVTGGASGNNIAMGGGGADAITVYGGGNNIVFGDSGSVNVQSSNFAVNTASTTDESQGGNDSITILGGGNNVAIGGAGNDAILINGPGSDIALGDLGSLSYTSSQLIVSSHDAPSDNLNATYNANDVITIGAGASGSDVVMGGAGNDTIAVDANGNNDVLGDSGSATIALGTGGSFTLQTLTTVDTNTGGEESIGGNDTITINGDGNNAVAAGAGDDLIDVLGTGNNIVLGDLGSITYSGAQLVVSSHDAASDTGNANYVSADVITIGAGASGSNIAMGGAGGDTISVDANGNNYVLGDSGSASLTVGSGGSFTLETLTTLDTNLSGEESIGGNDTITINGNGNNAVAGGAGDDLISILGTGNNIALGDLGSIIYSGSQVVVSSHDAASDTGNANYVSADVITIGAGASGSNIAMGGAGDDIITVDANGNNYVLGDSGSATLTVGSGGAFTLLTLTTLDTNPSGEESIGGNDTITINGNGNNAVAGGAGNDTISVVGTGNNIALGDLGSIIYSGSQVVMSSHDAASDTGNANYVSADVITIGAGASGSNIAMGGAGDDTIAVNANGNNYVLGDSGSATLTVSSGGAFTLLTLTTLDTNSNGEESIGGNDTITVNGNGNNAVAGGAGDDTVTVFGTGNNIVLGDLGSIIYSGSQVVVASHDAASDTGNANYVSTDVITIGAGASGSNIAMGGAGDDTISVNANGNNYILGDSGSATLTVGSAGDFTLQTLTTLDNNPGGEESIGGNDTITINGNGNNAVAAGAGNDTVTVFGTGNNIALGDLGSIVYGGSQVVIASHDAASDTGNADYASADVINVGAGAGGSNVVMGGAGNDTIGILANGNNFVLGDSGVATLSVLADTSYRLGTLSTTDNLLSGEESIGGDDVIIVVGNGGNIIAAGAGDDRVAIDGAGANVVLGDLGLVTLQADGSLLVASHDAASDTGNADYRSDDSLYLGVHSTGNDIVMGGAGNDAIGLDGSGNNEVLGDSGQAVLANWYTAPVLLSLTTVDPIGSGEEQIGGNDTIAIRGNGLNHVMAGNGQDTITSSGSGNNVLLGDFGVIVRTTVGGVTGYDVTGHGASAGNGNTRDNDTIRLFPTATGNNTIMGGGGSDSILIGGNGNYTHSGDNVVFGDDGDVSLVNTSNGVVWQDQTVDEADGGNDQIQVAGYANGDNSILGGAGSDVIDIYGSGDNTILGDQGLLVPVNGITTDITARDTAIGAGDIIDIHLAANGNNTVLGEAGDDQIISEGFGLNTILGDSGIITRQLIGDRLYPLTIESNDIGLGGNDTITLTHGNNFVIGGAGADTISGGDQNDFIIGDDGLFQFAANVNLTSTPLLMQSEHFEDGGNDVISTGDGLFNYVIGGTGADTINGGAGADLLAGDQALIQWESNGYRSFFTTIGSVPTSSADDIINGAGGPDDILGGEGADTISGGAGSDVLMGDDGHITFVGNTEKFAETITPFSPGADTIISGGGHDFIFGGGPQNNFIVADPLNDMIFNTDGRIDLQHGGTNNPTLANPPVRTALWSLPPLLGNPIVSMVGNWFTYTQPIDLDTQSIQQNAAFYESLITVAGLTLQQEMGVGGDYVHALERGDHYPAAHGLSLVAQAEASEAFVSGALAPQHAIGGNGRGILGSRDTVGAGIVAALDLSHDQSTGFVFDSENGVWIEETAHAGGPILDLLIKPAPVIDFSAIDELLMAAE